MDGELNVSPGLGNLKSFGTGSKTRLDRSSSLSEAAAKGAEKKKQPTRIRIDTAPTKQFKCFIKSFLNVVS
jgi:hypothetical protein